MGQVKVTNIQLDVDAKKKDGSTFKAHKIVLMNEEKGTTKSEQVPAFVKFTTPVTDLSVGDVVNARYEQNGNFWNLKDITLISKGSSGGSSSVQPASSGNTYSKGGGYKEDPEKQQAIIRQNVKSTAADVVLKLVEVGVYDKKKLAPDFVVDEILRIARRFEGYCSGKEDAIKIEQAVSTDVPAPVKDEDDEVF